MEKARSSVSGMLPRHRAERGTEESLKAGAKEGGDRAKITNWGEWGKMPAGMRVGEDWENTGNGAAAGTMRFPVFKKHPGDKD